MMNTPKYYPDNNVVTLRSSPLRNIVYRIFFFFCSRLNVRRVRKRKICCFFIFSNNLSFFTKLWSCAEVVPRRISLDRHSPRSSLWRIIISIKTVWAKKNQRGLYDQSVKSRARVTRSEWSAARKIKHFFVYKSKWGFPK